MNYRVTKSHHPDSTQSFEIESGRRLKFERRPTEWEGWIWCETEDHQSCWVPENWVTITSEPSANDGVGWCFLKRDYRPDELAVKVGDQLDGRMEESGWLWARTADGHKGWVPLDTVERISS